MARRGVGVLALQANSLMLSGNLRVKDEMVEDESAAGSQLAVDVTQADPLVVQCHQVADGVEGDGDELGWFGQGEIAEIGLDEGEQVGHTCGLGLLLAELEHLGRGIHADDGLPPPGRFDGDASVAHPQLDHRPLRAQVLLNVEGQVALRSRRRPRPDVVDVGKGIVFDRLVHGKASLQFYPPPCWRQKASCRPRWNRAFSSSSASSISGPSSTVTMPS